SHSAWLSQYCGRSAQILPSLAPTVAHSSETARRSGVLRRSVTTTGAGSSSEWRTGMKTVKADAGRDKRKDDRFDMALKRRAARLPAYGAKGLTCAEA